MKLLNHNKNNIENQFVYLFLFFLKINKFFFSVYNFIYILI